MANIKVSELPAASAASTSQEFEVNDSGTSKKVTGSQIKSFVKDGLVLTDITDVTASITELNYVDGVTSAIQTQLNDKFKQRTITGTTDQITVTNGDGVSGNPTIAAVIASQAEAEAGTNTTKLMTPERVEQHMKANDFGRGNYVAGTVNYAQNTWYQNTTGRPVYLNVRSSGTAGSHNFDYGSTTTAFASLSIGDGASGTWNTLSLVWLPDWYIRLGFAISVSAFSWEVR